jgi:NAD(P) transhydrogenase subunit beta
MAISMGNSLMGAGGFLAVFCILYGLWRLSSLSTSVYGIRIAGLGLLLAVIGEFLDRFGAHAAATPRVSFNAALAATALALGAAAAWWRSRRPHATSLAERLALFNGLGAAGVSTIAALELFTRHAQGPALLAILTAALLAAISLSGSWVAAAKLQGSAGYTLRLSGRPAMIGSSLLAAIALGVYIARTALTGIAAPVPYAGLIGLFAGSGVLCGLLITLPIRVADLPIAVSIGNAMTGVAIALLGWVLHVPVLMIVGMLVAGAGLSLAQSSAKALNRLIGDTVFWDIGTMASAARPIDAGNAGIFMRFARKVVIVPGYGLAAAQAQHKLAEFIQLLLAAGVDVKVVVHPFAGRMPGQMEGLLADAGIADNLIVQLAEAADSFAGADVALVIGANDVVNPAAGAIKSLPFFGMPVLNAGMAKTLYVIKRGHGAGYAGIANPVFNGENCSLIHGEAQSVLANMIEAMKLGELSAAA